MSLNLQMALEEAVDLGCNSLRMLCDEGDFKATGDLINSVHRNGTDIVCNFYVFSLIFGLPPTKKIPPFWEGTKIYTWVRIKLEPDAKKAISTAYLVARKLHFKGNRIYRKEADPLDVLIVIEEVKDAMRYAINDWWRDIMTIDDTGK